MTKAESTAAIAAAIQNLPQRPDERRIVVNISIATSPRAGGELARRVAAAQVAHLQKGGGQ